MTTHKKIECRRCGCLVESVSGDSEGVGEYLPQGWKFTQPLRRSLPDLWASRLVLTASVPTVSLTTESTAESYITIERR